MGRGPRNTRLDFGGNPELGFKKRILYLLSRLSVLTDSQPGIQRQSLAEVRALPTALKLLEESCAVARKPHDAAAVLFGLKFTDNIH